MRCREREGEGDKGRKVREVDRRRSEKRDKGMSEREIERERQKKSIMCISDILLVWFHLFQ